MKTLLDFQNVQFTADSTRVVAAPKNAIFQVISRPNCTPSKPNCALNKFASFVSHGQPLWTA